MITYPPNLDLTIQICRFSNMINNLELLDLFSRSNYEIAAEIGARFKSYRIALRLTQKDVSEQSGVSIMTIVRFEKGEGNAIRLNNLIALMRAIQKLDCIQEMIPEMSESLYKTPRKQAKRVRRKADEK